MTDPEKKGHPPDDLDHLEQMHQKLKEQQEAWRRLLEKMDRLTRDRTEKNTLKKPNS